MNREAHYQEKSLHYGAAHTRFRKLMELVNGTTNKKVLDIGCSKGYIGAKIKSLGNYVAGIDISWPAIQEASKFLDKAYVFDIEGAWPDLDTKYDLAILPEIIEHVFDPIYVLNKINENLNLEGEIIITTPNILIWTNRIKILLGNFKYTDQGLMDFGHIRFITHEYLKEILDKSGFKIEEENHIVFPGKLTKILKLWPSLFASQFILKARKI